MRNRNRNRNRSPKFQEPMEPKAAIAFLAENTGRLTSGDYLALDGIRIAYFLATNADPDDMELLISDAARKHNEAFYWRLNNTYNQCGRELPKQITAAAGILPIWEVMVTLIADMLETICPKELRDAIRQDEVSLNFSEKESPDPVQPAPEDTAIRRLMSEVPGFDKSPFNPREAGYDCRGCEFYLPKECRCRCTECQIRKRQRNRQSQ